MYKRSWFIFVLFFAASLCVSPGVVLANKAKATKIIAAKGITLPKTCQDFSERKTLEKRRKVWASAINEIAKKHPKYLVSWIVGAKEPPKLVLQETAMQRDCLLAAIVKDAANAKTKLLLDFGDGAPNKKRMRLWNKRLTKSSTWRRHAATHFTRSHYRSASAQAGIWWRKYTFAPPRSFNAVSAHAAKKCGLTTGHSWKPRNSRHKKCWGKHLSAKERQQEILNASSAPGLSRHHWGTDIDIFGLNPRKFRDRGMLHDEYVWLDKNALKHGFFQTYTGPQALKMESYMEERWHWSYYPIGQALYQWSRKNSKAVSAALTAQWDGFEKRWNGKRKRPFFSYVRERWRAYFFHIAPVSLSLELDISTFFAIRAVELLILL